MLLTHRNSITHRTIQPFSRAKEAIDKQCKSMSRRVQYRITPQTPRAGPGDLTRGNLEVAGKGVANPRASGLFLRRNDAKTAITYACDDVLAPLGQQHCAVRERGRDAAHFERHRPGPNVAIGYSSLRTTALTQQAVISESSIALFYFDTQFAHRLSQQLTPNQTTQRTPRTPRSLGRKQGLERRFGCESGRPRSSSHESALTPNADTRA